LFLKKCYNFAIPIVGNEKRKKAKIFKKKFVNSKKGFNFAIQKLKKKVL